jgi:hypothetical protein
MNDTPNDPKVQDRESQDPNSQDRELAKRKLVGRAMVVGLVLLVAIYALFTFLGRR